MISTLCVTCKWRGDGTYLPQPVFFPHRDTSKEVRMMQQREQVGAEQNWVCPLSPILQIRRVPCQRRFSFPADRPVLTNCPRVSTAALENWTRQFFLFMIKEKMSCVFFFFTYKHRSQLKTLRVLQSCTRVGQVGMWFRVSTMPWTVRPLQSSRRKKKVVVKESASFFWTVQK